MLDRVSAEDEARMDRVIGELEQFDERVKQPRREPVEGAGIFGRAQQKQQRQCQAGKELNPAVEPQIAGKAP